MNKTEYMNDLEKALRQFDMETRTEIMEDYEAHFMEAAEQGIDEETVIRDLGSIDELIAELKENSKEATGVVVSEQDMSDDSEYYGFDGEHYIEGAVIGGSTVEIVAAESPDDMFHLYYQELDENVELYQEERDGILYAGIKGKNGRFFVKNVLEKLFDSIFGKENSSGADSDDSIPTGNSTNALAPGNCMDFGPGQKIIVLVPAGMKMITLNSATGNINVSGLNCEILTVNTSTSLIKAKELECREISIKNISGYIEVSGAVAERLIIKNTSGSIKTEFISGQYCEQNTVSGSISSELSFADFSLKSTSGSVNAGAHYEINEGRLSTISGSCNLKLYDEVNLTAHVSSVSGSVKLSVGGAQVNSKGNHVFGTGKAQIYMNSVSGSVRIN